MVARQADSFYDVNHAYTYILNVYVTFYCAGTSQLNRMQLSTYLQI